MAAPATQRASELGNRPGKASCGLRPGFEHAGPYPYQISFPLRPPCRTASCEAVRRAVSWMEKSFLFQYRSLLFVFWPTEKSPQAMDGGEGKATFLFGQPTGSHSPVRPRLLLFRLCSLAALEASFPTLLQSRAGRCVLRAARMGYKSHWTAAA